jgi:hypothetical protein
MPVALPRNSMLEENEKGTVERERISAWEKQEKQCSDDGRAIVVLYAPFASDARLWSRHGPGS